MAQADTKRAYIDSESNELAAIDPSRGGSHIRRSL
jgi:hypothetical protein